MLLLYGLIENAKHLTVISDDFYTEFKDLTKRDCLIFYATKELLEDEQVIPWLEKRPYTTVLLDADREVYDTLEKYEKVKKYNGLMHKLSDSVYHFADSGVYVFGKKNILISNIGSGAHCLDPDFYERSRIQFKHLAVSLKRNKYKVDLVLSLIPPHRVSSHFYMMPCTDLHSQYMDIIYDTCEYDDWYFLSSDEDIDYENIHSIYRAFTELDGKIFIEYLDDDEEEFDCL